MDGKKLLELLKENRRLVIFIILFILSFNYRWFALNLSSSDNYVIGIIALIAFFIVPPMQFMFLIFCLCTKKTNKNKKICSILAFINVFIFFSFPFNYQKAKYLLFRYDDRFVKTAEIALERDVNSNGVVDVKDVCPYLASCEYVEKFNDNNIGFYVWKGQWNGGNAYLVYSRDEIKGLNEVIPIYQIKKLRDKWYYVVDDY